MGVMVFLRQHLLDRELIRLLNHSRESFDNLNASAGANPAVRETGFDRSVCRRRSSRTQQPDHRHARLFRPAAQHGAYAGAATAGRKNRPVCPPHQVLGRQPDQLRPAGARAQELRSTSTPGAHRSQVDRNRSGKLSASRSVLSSTPALPKVLGDSNQLLQVCLQLIGNCLHLLSERGGHLLTLSTEQTEDVAVLRIATDSTPRSAAQFDTEDSLALSACQGILQEHRGQISSERRDDGAIAAARRTSGHRIRSVETQGFYGAGAVAISTVRLSCPQAA